MSALEQIPLSAPERRSTPRLRIRESLPIVIGRSEGILIDLSARGARVRHDLPSQRGATLRMSFTWQGERFTANADVLSSRVFALGRGSQHATTYESRLRFVLMTEASAQILARVLASIENRSVREWVANLRGWTDSDRVADGTHSGRSYVRCRLIADSRWEVKLTHDQTQPDEGFVLPENVEKSDVDRLCATYRRLDGDGRHLIRLIASAVIAA